MMVMSREQNSAATHRADSVARISQPYASTEALEDIYKSNCNLALIRQRYFVLPPQIFSGSLNVV